MATKTLTVSAFGPFNIDQKFDAERRTVEKEIRQAGGQRPKQAIIIDEPKVFKVVMDVTGYGQKDLNVTVTGDEITVNGSADTNVDGKKGKKSFQKAFQVPSDVKINEVSTALSSDGFLVFSMPREGGVTIAKRTTKKVKTTTIQITTRGEFNQDNFFSDMKDSFVNALRETQSKYPDTQNIRDENSLIQTLREKNTKDNKQVESVNDTERNHNVVIDVKGYKKESITITAAEETHTINVEGNEQGRYSSKSFKKTYVLNESYNIKDSLTGLSSDGILAIKVPRSSTNNTEVKKSVKKVTKTKTTKEQQDTTQQNTQHSTDQSDNTTTTTTTNKKTSTVTDDESTYQIEIPVTGYKESDISINVSDVNEVTVNGQAEVVIDGKTAKKKFSKPYKVPENLNVSMAKLTVTSSGIIIMFPKGDGSSQHQQQTEVKRTVKKVVKTSSVVS